jgi:hypothetical protein
MPIPANQIANPQIPAQFNPRLNNPAQVPQVGQNNQYPIPQNQINPAFQQHNQTNMIPNQQQLQNPNVNFQQAQMFQQQQQQMQLDQQNQLIQQQKLAEQERQRQQREQEEQQTRRRQQREYEEKQAQLSQQKILEQKLLEQQLFEKELQIKKQQLEQQEQQLRLQQQQIQMQQQQQQYLLMQQQQYHHQQQQQQQQKLAETVINQQQFSNSNSNGLYQTQNVQNTQHIPAQSSSAQNIQYQPVVMQPANISSQVLAQPAPNQPKTTVENKKPELNADLLAKIDPVSVYKPGYFNQINLAPSAMDVGLNTQTKPMHNNFQTNFTIQPQADIKPSNNINPTTYNQNVAQAQATMPNQQYQQFPISNQQQMNIQPQAQPPKPPVQSRPKAIDDLFDLFDDKNYNQNNAQPAINVLQPKLADVFTAKQIVDLNQIAYSSKFLFFLKSAISFCTL